MFWVKIAVIDDGIYDGYYENTFATQDLMVDDELNIVPRTQRLQGVFSHATVCAAIIKKYCADAELVSIKVLDEENARGSADKLVAAIDWCAENNVRLVNASLGSTYIGDYEPLRKCINRAYRQGVIVVSAVDNNSFVSFPAFFSCAIGVRSYDNPMQDFIIEKKKILPALHPCGKKLWLVKSYDGVNLLAYSNHELIDFRGNSDASDSFNSYAAPFVTAMIAQSGCDKELTDMLFEGGFFRLDWLERFIYIADAGETFIADSRWFDKIYNVTLKAGCSKEIRDIIESKETDVCVFGQGVPEADVKKIIKELGIDFISENGLKFVALGDDKNLYDLGLRDIFKWTRTKGSLIPYNSLNRNSEDINSICDEGEICSIPVVRLISDDVPHSVLVRLLTEFFKNDNYKAKGLTDDSIGAVFGSEFSVEACINATALEKMVEKLFAPDIIIEHSYQDFNSEADIIIEISNGFSPEGFSIAKKSETYFVCTVDGYDIMKLREFAKNLYEILVKVLG